MIINCPNCKHEFSDEMIATIFAAIGGRAGRGKSKARTSAQARKAGLASAKARALKLATQCGHTQTVEEWAKSLKNVKNIALNGNELRRKSRDIKK